MVFERPVGENGRLVTWVVADRHAWSQVCASTDLFNRSYNVRLDSAIAMAATHLAPVLADRKRERVLTCKHERFQR